MSNANLRTYKNLSMADFLPAQYRDLTEDQLKNTVPELYTMAKQAWDAYLTSSRQGYDLDKNLLDRINNLAFLSSGLGGYANQIQTFLTCLDRYQHNILPVNSEYSGFTFITRPRLCLRSSNLRTNRRMVPLDTRAPNSMAFMIRALLDTNLGTNDAEMTQLLQNSPMFDFRNPFLIPCCNALTHVGGFPDPMVQTATTEGGFYSEDQTYAIGSDDLNRTYNFQLGFKDIQHGPIAALFYYWLEYMRCVTRGLMAAYADDIDQQRMNYTVSIYRFNLDPSKHYITKYSKATGCFPTSLPLGAMMNKNNQEHFVNAATEFSIPFVANKVEYQDYAILLDFNALVRRYCPSINLVRGIDSATGMQASATKESSQTDYECSVLPHSPLENFRGLPYITTDKFGIRLEFRRVPNPAYPKDFDLIDQMGALDYALETGLSGGENSPRALEIGSYYNRRMSKWIGPNSTNNQAVNFSKFNNYDKISVLRFILNQAEGGASHLNPVSAEAIAAENARITAASIQNI